MSNTPLTDAESFLDGPLAGSGAELVSADFARSLERHCAAMAEDLAWHVNESDLASDALDAYRAFIEKCKEGK